MASTVGLERMSLPEAARRLRMTWGQVYNALLAGKLEGELLGSRWSLNAESVERLVRERGLAGTAR